MADFEGLQARASAEAERKRLQELARASVINNTSSNNNAQRTEVAAQLTVEPAEESIENREKTFMDTVTPIAKRIAEKFGNAIPWEALVLQAGLESGFKLNARTLFGIKATRGELANSLQTFEFRNGRKIKIRAAFRDFGGQTLEERVVNACIGYCNFIIEKPRYKKALEIYRNGGTPADYLREIARAGYATGPQYFRALTRIASTHSVDINRRNVA